MIYLTRLILNPGHRDVRRDIARPYEMHRTLLRAFTHIENGNRSRVLFRIDSPKRDYPIVYVQSQDEPDWTFLETDTGYLLPESDPHGNPAVRAWTPSFREGQMLQFRLRANPTRRDSESGKRLGQTNLEDQIKWLARKGEAGGFAVGTGSLHVIPEGMISLGERRAGSDSTERRHTLRALSVRYDGMLRVRDPGLFESTLTGGIGPAKGLGFGLLSLARAG